MDFNRKQKQVNAGQSLLEAIKDNKHGWIFNLADEIDGRRNNIVYSKDDNKEHINILLTPFTDGLLITTIGIGSIEQDFIDEIICQATIQILNEFRPQLENKVISYVQHAIGKHAKEFKKEAKEILELAADMPKKPTTSRKIKIQ